MGASYYDGLAPNSTTTDGDTGGGRAGRIIHRIDSAAIASQAVHVLGHAQGEGEGETDAQLLVVSALPLLG